MRIPFTKYHGLGNDFVLLDSILHPIRASDAAWQSLAIRLCDRHSGIGADGLLVLEGSTSSPIMRIINADGSLANMCGNGIRCIARHLLEQHGLSSGRTITTPAGQVVVDVHLSDGVFHAATVNMGRPILAPESIPLRGVHDSLRFAMPEVPGAAEWRRAAGVNSEVSAVSMGNPHLVVRCTDLDAVPLRQAGPALEHHPTFPDRINVHFVKVIDESHVQAMTWERGAGPTLACGSGACAISVALASLGLTRRHLTVSLPGGNLDICWESDDHVRMRGPATHVFSGTIELDLPTQQPPR
jgi:diaminopimelate epimerase